MSSNKKSVHIQLPNLEKYRKDFLNKEVSDPLPIPFSTTGLLAELPPPPPGKTGWPWTEETDPNLYKQRDNWPKLSIVTPSYNQGQFIEETIRSVLLQNYPNLEYVVIDGGSSDDSVEIINKYKRWFSLWLSEKDRGQSHAINRGLSIITGEFWQWLNSDDRYFPNVLHEIALVLSTGEYNTLYGGVYESTDDSKTSYSRISFRVNEEKMLNPKSVFNIDYYYKPEATILSVEMSRKAGGFREDLHNLFDGEFMIRYIKFSNPVYTQIILVHYRIHELTKTIANSQRMYEEYFRILDEHHRVGSIQWFYSVQRKAGFLSTLNQVDKNRVELIKLALKLLVNSPYVLISRSYWGLWRKILMQTVT